MKTLHKTLFALVFLLYSLNANAQSSIASWIYQGGGTATGPNPAGLDTTTFPGTNGRLFSPVPGDLDNDGDMDLIVGTQSGILFYYENIGTPTAPSWVRTSHPNLDTLIILPLSSANEMRPQLEDIDNDGDLDLFVGVRYNYFHGQWGMGSSSTKFRDIIYFENTGTPAVANFVRGTMPGVDEQTNTFVLNTGEFTNLGFVDIDDDGDSDFFTIGSDSINYFQNIGTSTVPSFQRFFRNDPLNPLGALSTPTYTSMLISMPDFEDFDNDGDFDLYFVNESGFVQFVENIGTASVPNFSPYTPVQGSPAISTGLDGDLGSFGCLIFEDLDNDNVKDAIYGNFNPGVLDWWKGVPNCTDDAATINVATCSSYTVPSGDETYTSSGTFIDTIPTTLGCDSVLTINLTISPNGVSTDTQIACDTYAWIDGNTYTSSNNTATFVISGGSANGCDSIITLDLTINNSSSVTDTQVACVTYTWIDGNTYTTSNNTAIFTLTNGVGCDSVVTLDLTINPLDDASFSYGATSYCSNDTDPVATVTGILGGAFSATTGLVILPSGTIDVSASTPGTYTVTYTTPGPCVNSSDVIVTILATSTGTDTQVACNSYTWIDGNTYTSSNNTAMFVLTNAVGCDSTVTLDLTINNSSTGTDTQTHCITYTWIDGIAYTASNNTATFTLTNAAGCDSVVTLDLTINPLDDASFSYGAATYCSNDSDPIATVTGILGGTFSATAGLTILPSGTIDLSASTSGIHTVTYTTPGPCVNSFDVIVTILATSTGTDTQVACDSYTWIDGNTYTVSNNTATHVLTNAAGCDSTVTLDLTINNSNTGIDTQIACDSYMWIDGNTYTSSNNIATFVLTNAAGCDSTVTLDLTINYSTTGTDVQVDCDSYMWIDGNTYTSSNNTAIFVLINAAGCDSTVSLDLTINYSTIGTDTQVACDSYTWIDGNTYTTSNNTATFVLTNAVGCDSTVTLDLTMNNSNTGTDTQIACDSYTWIDGNTYTVSNNTATFVLTNAVGCDSTVTIDLTINNSNTGTDLQVACDSFTWIDGNTYTTSNNVASFVLTNAAGCDSTVTLDLIVNYSNTGIDTQAACDSFTWIDGLTYTTSNNTATFVLTNASGCDSTVTLDLTVNSSYAVSDAQIHCDSYTWIDGITYTSDNNTAVMNLTTVEGCDSIVTLDLIINTTNVGTSQSADGITITADATVATYEWIDCDNGNAIIPGETNQIFTATANGNYAVIVNQNDCIDTSSCVNVSTVGLNVLILADAIKVYPNPTYGDVQIDLGKEVEQVDVRVLNLSGQLVSKESFNGIDLVKLSIDGEVGVYFIEVSTNGNAKAMIKVVKQ